MLGNISKWLKQMVRPVKILGIESSCDDTAAAVVSSRRKILGESILTHHELLEKWGGVHPYETSKGHRQEISNVVNNCMKNAKLDFSQLDAVACTVGPGLTPCLKVGLLKAKEIALDFNKPLIAVNHLEGHVLMATMENPEIKFPFLVLLISGGHCMLTIAKDIGSYELLGTTMDDSVGEAFDKIGRLLGLPVIGGGKALEAHASLGTPKFKFTVPMTQREKKRKIVFSFSGLKSSVLKQVREIEMTLKSEEFTQREMNEIMSNNKKPTVTIPEEITRDLAASFQEAAFKQLHDKTQLAIQLCKEKYPSITTLVVSGGVASNQVLRGRLAKLCNDERFQLCYPNPRYCTDNGVMIAWAGLQKFNRGDFVKNIVELDVRAKWPLSNLL
jgi:N6-L-threonylcarbamoyladenine synthase